jgi:hypothetical protein
MSEMSIPMSVPLDTDGFLRRECSTCERQFKWFSGATADRPDDAVDADNYCCPYCGVAAATDQWWTREQLDYASELATAAFSDVVEEHVRSWPAVKTGLVQTSVEYSGSSTPPSTIDELNDMVMVASPCHSWEPIKVTEGWDEPLHCLVCGDLFQL